MTHRALLPIFLLAGCSLVDQIRDDKLAALSDSDTTTGAEPEDTTPMPTTGTTGEPEESSETSGGGEFDIGRPPTIADFFAPLTVNAAGPLVVDAEIIGATKTELVLERDGEEVERVKNPSLPWKLPITSEKTFDGNYTVTLRAWASTGAMSEKHADTIIDLPTGGTLRAQWQEPGVIPSTAAAVVPVVAGDLAAEDGALVAMAIGGELWLHRFDTQLNLRSAVHAFCGDGICAWAPVAMAVDRANQGHVFVAGNDFNGQAWLMKFDVSGQPVWPSAIKLPNGHVTGVAVDTEFEQRVFLSGWRELDQGSNARLWIVQDGEVTGATDYASTCTADGVVKQAWNQASDVLVLADGRIILSGTTTVDSPEEWCPSRGSLFAYENFSLVEKFHVPTWGEDELTQSSFATISATQTRLFAGGWLAGSVDNEEHVHTSTFKTDFSPIQSTILDTPSGSYSTASIHPENTPIFAGEYLPSGAATLDLWGQPYSSPVAFSRILGSTVDRFGRVYLVGERAGNNTTLAAVEAVNP